MSAGTAFNGNLLSCRPLWKTLQCWLWLYVTAVLFIRFMWLIISRHTSQIFSLLLWDVASVVPSAIYGFIGQDLQDGFDFWKSLLIKCWLRSARGGLNPAPLYLSFPSQSCGCVSDSICVSLKDGQSSGMIAQLIGHPLLSWACTRSAGYWIAIVILPLCVLIV